jgi:phage minor structural protein
MISLNGKALPFDDYYIRELPSGLDELIFQLSIWDEYYPLLTEETALSEASNGVKTAYLVKAIDGGGDIATVKCQIDLDEWKASIIDNFSEYGHSIGYTVGQFAPEGWTVTSHFPVATVRTVEADHATPFELLDKCRESYEGAAYRINTATKTIEIYDEFAGEDAGAFLTRDINLKAVQYKGKSSALVTRLYAYGKDGLTFADINDGKPYLDNFTYSDKVLCGVWSDGQFTNAANLLDATRAKLDEMAIPERSYSCEVADLSAVDPAKYSALSFGLFTKVALIDETRSAGKIMHRVVERWRYPYLPEKNKVILSNAPRRITVQVQQALNGPISGGRISGGSIGSSAIASGAITVNKIADGSITSTKIADNAVTTNKVLNAAIEYAKLSGGLQVTLTDILTAQAVFAGVIYSAGSVQCSSFILNQVQMQARWIYYTDQNGSPASMRICGEVQ